MEGQSVHKWHMLHVTASSREKDVNTECAVMSTLLIVLPDINSY